MYEQGRLGWTDGFTSFSTVFQSYQDDGPMIMKGCDAVCNGTPFTVKKILSGVELPELLGRLGSTCKSVYYGLFSLFAYSIHKSRKL